MRMISAGTHGRAAKTAMIFLLATAAGGSGLAQAPAPGSPQAPAAPKAAAAEGTMPRVALTAGRSTVLTTDFDITRIAVTNPGRRRRDGRAAARDPDRRQGRPARSA